MERFKLVTELKPRGDQPKAIRQLVEGVRKGYRYQTLVGVTGSGKTFTIACVIEQLQRPTLIIAHNKTLAAQLCAELRQLFPYNAVEYFVSFYDYYQPEAYIPQTDTYIEKDCSINDEIDRLRHAATQAVSERRDVIVVASVSCIYGLGSPELYQEMTLQIRRGERISREHIIERLVDLYFSRNDISLDRGTFRVRGDVVEIHPVDEDTIVRVDLFGDEVDEITIVDPLTGEVLERKNLIIIYPASHYVATKDRIERALISIERELNERLQYFLSQGRILEAQRLEQRVRYDMEMLRETGYCTGIENYSRHFDGRKPGEPPYTLIDFFPDDYLLIIDESHQTIPQLRAMYEGDRSRKYNLVEYGWRLPSAYDNRPLTFEEFEQRINQVIFMSATPGPYEFEKSEQVVELIVRPTGLLDPDVEVRPTKGQIEDLLGEIKKRVDKGQRVLVTTLTKKMAEALTAHLIELGVRAHYLHSDIETIERTEILRDLRAGKYDVLIGINLLREGLDLPEVSLVAILDADREGFLRSETSLIQIMGRAARHVEGKVIMYSDTITPAMQRAIDETMRRRRIQEEYNRQHGITPQSIQKAVYDYIVLPHQVAERRAEYATKLPEVTLDELPLRIEELEREMRRAAERLEFERAAELRDEIKRLRAILLGQPMPQSMVQKGTATPAGAPAVKRKRSRNKVG
ncbi:MAG: excinuclease ABC subunit UvrB [Armatimonadota bacterium]|nr:excinuclease ABC subunit UvrB [Armatimonadota bacterium]MCX7777841.1 excinuclease ABC subunit UvrB [Armatimonadota bacterium]MDW8025833.1 excinuclease ABC subunit UvrB [Armatimonadota bacterium]